MFHPLGAQDTVQPFAFLHVAKDLPDKRIQSIVQDEDGFVWIATFNGLFRYDGLRYKEFKNLPGPGEGISFNHIRMMYIHAHRFLVIEGDRLVNILDLETEKVIYKSPVELLFKQSLSYQDRLYFQFEDTDFKTLLFAFTKEGTLDLLPFSLPNGMRMEMATLDQHGEIWFFDKKGWIWKSNPQKETLTVFDSISYNGRRLLFLPELFTDNAGHIWAFDNAHLDFNGIHMIDGGKPVKYGELANYQVCFPQPDYDKFWIFNTRTKLLSEFNLATKVMTPILTLPVHITNIRSIMKDNQQNIWVGSHFINPNGILLIHPHINAFEKILFRNNEQRGLGIACRGLAELPSGEILIGSYDGLYTWSPVTNHAQPLYIDNTTKDAKLVNIWKIIPQPERNQFWFTKEENGIFKYSFATRSVVNFVWRGDVSNRALGMIMDDDGVIWMGTRSGVSFFDTYTESYIKGPDHMKQFFGINGYDWFKSDTNQIWLSSSNGLYAFDQASKAVTNRYATNTHPYLYSNEVFDVVKDGDAYWIATDNGLHKLNGNTIDRYTTEQGLAHDVVADLLLDDQHNLWIATFHGLSKMNTTTGEFQNFYVEDGLPHNEFNRLGKLKSSDGRLYFSSQNGVLHFKPDEVIKEAPAYDLVYTGFATFTDDGILERWPI
jgi:ligand-binding sensor domain-containing protein